MTEAQIKLLADLRSGAVLGEPVAWRYRYRGSVNVTPSEAFAREQGTHIEPLFASPDLASLAEMIEGLVGALEQSREAVAQAQASEAYQRGKAEASARVIERHRTASDSRVSELRAENEKMREAVAEEREACARMVERGPAIHRKDGEMLSLGQHYQKLATAIRSRALAKDHPNGQG